MEAERLERIKKTTKIHLAMESKETLKRIREDFPDNPEAMDYFYNLFYKVYCEGESFSNGKKLIGTLCIQVPEELIYAAGAVPVRLCSGAYAFDQIGAEFMPAKSCSIVKATLGMLNIKLLPYSDSLSLIVNPTTCDQKKKGGEMLEEMGYKVYHLEIPPSKDTEEARLYWQRSIKGFAVVLEKITGQRITKNRLAEAIKKINKARSEWRRLHIIKKQYPSVVWGKDTFLVANAYFFDDIERWTEAVYRLNNELEERWLKGFSSANKNSPRILFTGSPPIFPNLKLPILIEQTGGIITADEVCSSDRLLHDTVAADEYSLYDMIPAIADRYLKPCTCPIFVSNNDRKRRLIEMIKGFAVDGVVYNAFAGCHLFEMEHRSIGKMLSDEGIPMLYIETDYSPDDAGQLSTRVEAFIESLKAKKRKM